MKAHHAPQKRLMTVLAACLATAMLTCDADAWTGRTTANVNLRAAPSLDSAVITGLPSGMSLSVEETRDGWVKVTHQSDTFGYHGWIYGTYVAPVENAEYTPGNISPLTPPAPAAVTPAPLKSPPAVRSAPAASAETAAPQSPPAPGDAAPASAAAAPAPVSPIPPGKSAPVPAFANDEPAEAAAVREILTTAPAAAATVTTPAGTRSSAMSWRPWVSLLLRLSTVILAAMALLMAHRALNTVRGIQIASGRS